MNISLIVAFDKNRAIGKENSLPWHLSEDLKLFKSLTTGHTIAMGKNTFLSIGKALPNRRNIVLSRNKNLKIENIEVFSSPEELIEKIKFENNETELFFIGGAQVYKHILPIVDLLYITFVDAEIENADAHFPDIDFEKYNLLEEKFFEKNEKNEFDFTFRKYEKKQC